MNNINKPLSNEEIHELFTMTLHGPPNQKTIYRMFATLAEVAELRKEKRPFGKEVDVYQHKTCGGCHLSDFSSQHNVSCWHPRLKARGNILEDYYNLYEHCPLKKKDLVFKLMEE